MRSLWWLVAATVGCGAVVIGAGMREQPPVVDTRATLLNFTAPITLPGVTLPAGSYVFELPAPLSNLDLVRVLSRDRTRVHFMGFTTAVERPTANLAADPVTFGELQLGAPRPIDTWFPVGDRTGHRFIYR